MHRWSWSWKLAINLSQRSQNRLWRTQIPTPTQQRRPCRVNSPTSLRHRRLHSSSKSPATRKATASTMWWIVRTLKSLRWLLQRQNRVPRWAITTCSHRSLTIQPSKIWRQPNRMRFWPNSWAVSMTMRNRLLWLNLHRHQQFHKRAKIAFLNQRRKLTIRIISFIFFSPKRLLRSSLGRDWYQARRKHLRKIKWKIIPNRDYMTWYHVLV